MSLLERSAGDLVARSTLTDALSAIADLKEAADIDKVDQALDKAFGGAITRVCDVLVLNPEYLALTAYTVQRLLRLLFCR